MYINIKDIRAAHEKGEKLDFLFFWGHTESKIGNLDSFCLSQWYPAVFEVEGIRYANAEQYMMAGKAKLFDDSEMLARILETTDPKNIKALGRKIKSFNEETWNANRFQIVTQGSIAKFSQNMAMKQFLLSTGDRILVEASPFDNIWGIGMGKDNENAKNPMKWRGANLLGFALMEAREYIRLEG